MLTSFAGRRTRPWDGWRFELVRRFAQDLLEETYNTSTRWGKKLAHDRDNMRELGDVAAIHVS